jgi:DNA repair exonuclease SbcCD ATPase subunit
VKVKRVEVEGFRGLVKEEFELDDLTVFSGEMGTGKTSHLLAILYGLTGTVPSSVNLDEMINVDSDHMWIKIEGQTGDQTFTVERSKRLGRSTTVKTDLVDPKITPEIFIEGREISHLFLGAPTEKTFRIDTLLGLSQYNQIATEISTVHLERRIEDLTRSRRDLAQASEIKQKIEKAEADLKRLNEERGRITRELRQNANIYRQAEEKKRKIEEQSRRNADILGKQAMIRDYEVQIDRLPSASVELEETVSELQARHQAAQKRVAYLEAVMQILDLEGKKIDEIPTCPVCGALLSSNALEKFRHHDEEYRHIIGEVTQVEVELTSKRQRLEEIKEHRHRREILQNEIQSIKQEIAGISVEPMISDKMEAVENTLKRRDHLTQEAREIDIFIHSLEEQISTYRALDNRIGRITAAKIDEKILRLGNLKSMIQNIRSALSETLSEVRLNQLNSLRASFKMTFRRIYPYQRLKDIDFETATVRGRDIIEVKGLAGKQWIHPNQMSTGENVAISFALLFAVNQLEATPILLLDEPEEGLDENGVQGLADILNNLKSTTQIIVATRNIHLTQLLRPSEIAS